MMQEPASKEQEYILDHILYKKIGQIIGMSIPQNCSLDEVKEMLKSSGQLEMLAEVEKAIVEV